MGLTIPLMLIVNFTVSNASRELLVSLLGENGADMLRLYLVMSYFKNSIIRFIQFICCVS